jgi:YHS domain-containing protein
MAGYCLNFNLSTMKKIFLSLLAATFAIIAIAQVPAKSTDGKYTLNLDENGCMLRGYDVVAMFTMPDQTVKGQQKFESLFQGAKYWFASAENKALFDANPEKYAPQFGGFCAVAVTEGNLRPVQVWTHEITDGKLVVNHNAKAKGLWDKRPAKKLKIANSKWPVVNQKEAKYDIIKSGETQESLAATSYAEKE